MMGEVGGWARAGGEEVTAYPVSAAELLFIKERPVSTLLKFLAA